MIPELGQLALALALCLALAKACSDSSRGARREVWMAATRPAARGQFVFVAIAFACLTSSFVANDFTVAYVATNSNSALPLQYRIRRRVGRARGLDAAVGPDALGVEPSASRFFQAATFRRRWWRACSASWAG